MGIFSVHSSISPYWKTVARAFYLLSSGVLHQGSSQLWSPICNSEPVSSTSRTAASILLFLAFIFLQPLSNGNELRKELGIWNRRFFTAGSFKAALPAELQLLPLTFIRRTAVREAA